MQVTVLGAKDVEVTVSLRKGNGVIFFLLVD
jgi:hypothetical protein